jgi:alkanesulfonate monooxygenase SsuD/methylene tetrahydromethanopterin reductase-like flavin-dependent oxidoreductase (luciferase family)
MFGVDRKGRGQLVEKRIELMRKLWLGETVEYEGRRVRTTPLPFTPGGPMLAYGGGTAVAARRAARLGMYFLSESHHAELEAAYAEEAERAGVPALGCSFPTPGIPLTVFVADDPDRAWAELGEYLMVDVAGYAQWNAHRTGTASVSFAESADALRAEKGEYQIITPAEAADYVARGIPLALQPLVGGIPPDIAWPYLEAAAAVIAAAQ